MVWHQRVSVYTDTVSLYRFPNEIEKCRTRSIIKENLLKPGTAIHYVVTGAGKVDRGGETGTKLYRRVTLMSILRV